MRRVALAVAVGGAILAALVLCEEARVLAFGWVQFLARVIPAVTVRGEAVATGVAFLVLFVLLLDLFARWCCRTAAARSDGSPRRWRFRWTASIVIVLVLLFAAGYSAMGIARQVGWLLSSQQ